MFQSYAISSANGRFIIVMKKGAKGEKGGQKGADWNLLWLLSFIKIPLKSPSLDHKEQNYFWPP